MRNDAGTQLLVFHRMGQIGQSFCRRIRLRQSRTDHFRQAVLFVCANQQIYSRIVCQTVSVGLHIASDSRHDGRGILGARPVKHLAGLLIRRIGHGTGVDHIDIGAGRKRHDRKPLLLEQCSHGLALIGIDFASEVVDCRRDRFTCIFVHHRLFGSGLMRSVSAVSTALRTIGSMISSSAFSEFTIACTSGLVSGCFATKIVQQSS